VKCRHSEKLETNGGRKHRQRCTLTASHGIHCEPIEDRMALCGRNRVSVEVMLFVDIR
jgi:hypothetical protein